MQRLNMDRVVEKFLERQRSHVTCSVHDSEMVTADMAKVVVTFNTDSASQTDYYTAVARMLKEEASPVENSFRKLRGSPIMSCVGFVKTNSVVVEYAEAEVAKMKVMASNLLMSPEDESLWEVRSSGNVKYLAKQSNDDLSQLVALAKVRAFNVPKLNGIAIASVQRSEFLAFVDSANASMRYGFVVKAGEDSLDVVDMDGDVVSVKPGSVVESAHLNGDDTRFAQKAGIEVPKYTDRQALIDYYTEVYNYSPEYLQELIDIINSHATF